MIPDFGETLVDAVLETDVAPSPFAVWLREVFRPPDQLVISTTDGTRFSGVVIVRDNVPVAAAMFRTGEVRRSYPARPPSSDTWPCPPDYPDDY